MLSGYRIIKLLSDQGLHRLQRAEDITSGEKVILKAIAPEVVDIKSIAGLTNEYDFLKRFSSEYIVRTHGLRKDDDGHTVLILEDIEGSDLGYFLQNNPPMSLDLFFTIAIAITRGLSDIHAINIIHKDISPKNILINLQTRKFKIIDFSIATELARESQEINVKGVLEGCFPYMSPEQTGRINRYLDYRSDFYSLGATFFEMLAGDTPFHATDALGYIAAHIAKKPARVDSLRADIPEGVAAMIDILLAKSADDRYQSSAGIIYDLERLQELHKTNQNSSSFSLRSRDHSERFDLPQKLYGREGDIAKLFAKFDKAAEGDATVLLVRGQSGIGKSSLIQEVSRKFSGNQIFFLKGKFDQFNKDIPYSALIQAFADAAEQIMRMEKEAYNTFTSEIRRLLGPNGEVITSLIPEFLNIIGTPPPLPYLNPQESQVRISNTLMDFISAFARPHDPLILFLDDMQWADIATLELLESLFTKVEFKNIFIILSYRANEVPSHHPLALKLDSLAKKTVLEAIDLAPLELPDINQMVADTLKVDVGCVSELAGIVSQKTQGNPFFIEEFLKDLWRKKLIYFDRTKAGWQYNINGIRELDVSISIIDFLLAKISVLDAKSKDTLKLAAALGNKFHLSTLSIIIDQSMLDTLQSLEQAIQEGLIIPLDRGYRLLQSIALSPTESVPSFDTSFKFQHDRIQQVCYSLIAPEHKKSIHLAIARILDRKKSEFSIPITEIVRHYNEAVDLITDDAERLKLIDLNRSTAKKALEANAYSQAKEYINTAIRLHRAEDWHDQYSLMFDIHKYAAEIHYYLNLVTEGNTYVAKLLDIVEDTLIKAEILTMQSLHFSAMGHLREAIDTAISSLHLCGYPFPRKINLFHVGITGIKLVVTVLFKSSKRLLQMPAISEPRHNLALKNLTNIGHAEFNLGNPFAYAVAFFTAALITMKYGFSNLAGYSFSCSSSVLMGVFKMGKLSRKLGVLAVEFNKKNDDLYLRSNTATVLACFTYYWHYDHKDLSEHFNHALQLAYQAGDNFHRASAAACHSRYLEDLNAKQAYDLNKKMKTIAFEANSRQNFEALEIIQGYYANLIGATDYSHRISYDNFNEVTALHHVQKTGNQTGLGGYISVKVEVLTLHERFKEAVLVARKLGSGIFGVIATKFEAEYRLYTFLARTRYYSRGFLIPRLGNIIQVLYQRWCIRAFWRNNPTNFADMESIAQAEMAMFYRRSLAVILAKIEKSIHTCKLHSNRMAAIAYHRAFLFAASRDLQSLAETYLKEAIHYYDIWGAGGISDFLKRKHSAKYGAALKGSSLGASSQPSHLTTHGQRVTQVTSTAATTAMASLNFDIDSITKGVQAIFAENKLGNLTSSILAAMMENAGASRGALILKDDNENLITHGLIDSDLDIKMLEPHPILVGEVPKTFIISTARTGKDGIIADIGNNNPFTGDPYFADPTAKSAISIPISFKRAVVGVVYLQNNHIINAFTAAHRQVLDIMAVSAAASIVNTKLQLSLEEKVRAKTKSVKAVLENVEQGILMIYDDELRIHPEYSSYLEQILERKDLANQRLSDILLMGSQLTPDQRSTLVSSLESMIHTPELAFKVNEHHLPREINYDIGGKTKIFELDWIPVLDDNDDVERILLTIRDVTNVKKLQSEINQQHEDVRMFSEISKISHDLFQEFVNQSQAMLARFMSIKQRDTAILQSMFIDVHTLKGLARTYGFVTLVDSLHQVEQVMAHTIKSGVFFTERMTGAVQELSIQLQSYIRVAAMHVDHGAVMAAQTLKHIEQIVTDEMARPTSDHETLMNSLCNAIYPTLEHILQDEITSIKSTAQSLGKERPNLHFINDGCRYPQQTQKLLRQLFVHLFNNALDHGLEPVAERLTKGKTAAGHITIEFVDDQRHPELIFSDDGRGLDLTQVRAAAERKGIISADCVLTPEATAELIFTPEFSTKSDVTTISGRGIGMGAVRSLLQAHHCEMKLQLSKENGQRNHLMKFRLILSKEIIVSSPEKRLRLAG